MTNSDTAVLSGSLSTHNGNGGGNINMTVRRVTSAKGWGEVRTHAHTTTKYNAIYKAQIQPIEAFLEDALGILAHLHVCTHLFMCIRLCRWSLVQETYWDLSLG